MHRETRPVRPDPTTPNDAEDDTLDDARTGPETPRKTRLVRADPTTPDDANDDTRSDARRRPEIHRKTRFVKAQSDDATAIAVDDARRTRVTRRSDRKCTRRLAP